jgi:hypothetical protein
VNVTISRVQPAILLSSPVVGENIFVFSFVTQAEWTYTVQASDSLTSTKLDNDHEFRRDWVARCISPTGHRALCRNTSVLLRNRIHPRPPFQFFEDVLMQGRLLIQCRKNMMFIRGRSLQLVSAILLGLGLQTSRAGTLSAYFQQPGVTNINLTTEGVLGWTHWGWPAPTDFNRKNIAGQPITKFYADLDQGRSDRWQRTRSVFRGVTERRQFLLLPSRVEYL